VEKRLGKKKELTAAEELRGSAQSQKWNTGKVGNGPWKKVGTRQKKRKERKKGKDLTQDQKKRERGTCRPLGVTIRKPRGKKTPIEQKEGEKTVFAGCRNEVRHEKAVVIIGWAKT